MENHSVLIVDDNPGNLQVLGKTLKKESYNIEFALDGKSALDWLKEKKFDLILLDVMMPDMDGFEVCNRIRADDRQKNLPIIFLTAQTDKESVLKGFEIGAQDYVTKPFDTPELLARVRTQLELRKSREDLAELNKKLEEKVRERTRQLRETNEELKIANQKLTGLDQAKTSFLQLISHEIRTPLNGILGPIHLLEQKLRNEDLDKLFEILDISVSRLEKFSYNALTITRLNTQKDKLILEPVDLGKILDKCLKESEDRIGSRKIRVEPGEPDKGILVRGEHELLKTCIHNILDNAIKFSPEQGEIDIRITTGKDRVVCEISDNGKGFPPELLEHPIELFSPGGQYADGELGLGLKLAKMVMEAHSGSIEVGNLKNGGAVVRLLFKEPGV